MGSTEIAMEDMVKRLEKKDKPEDASAFVLNSASGSGPALAESSRADDAQQVSSDAELDIFAASKLGKTEQIRALIESGRARVTDRDDDRITPLHLAAINGRIEACAYLIEQGAEVNAVGGDLAGTPLHWAGRNGLVEIIDLLIQHGADPRLFDSQGYSCLHSVVHSSNYWAVLYMLCQPGIDVNERDHRMGHTPLHRAVYQGDEVATQILLKMDADLEAIDRDGLTALHWAAFIGNRGCITQLLEAGADIRAKTRDRRTAQEISATYGNEDIWKSVVEELGFKPDGTRVRTPLSEPSVNIIAFSAPTISLCVTFTTMIVFPGYMAIVVSPLAFFYINFTQMARIVRRNTIREDLRKSPNFFGVIVGTAFLMTYIWVTRLRYDAPNNPAIHAAFIFLLVLSMLALLRTVFSDPGIVCAAETKDSLKPIIEGLARGKRLSTEAFCVECLALKPPHTRHCSICNKCVSFLKISNVHAVWMLNCIGVNNYIYLVVFILSFLADVLIFGYLTGIYVLTDILASNGDIPFEKLDRFLIIVTIWSTLSTLIGVVRIAWLALMGRLRDPGPDDTSVKWRINFQKLPPALGLAAGSDLLVSASGKRDAFKCPGLQVFTSF